MRQLYFIFVSFLLFSCAEIVPPTGGEKDTSPPEVKSIYPKNGALLFVEDKIEIKFNEFFKIKTSGDNVFISPSLKEKPKYKVVGKKLFISFQEELLKNTTYNINFGEAIEDINEGNALKDFNYIFSTGTFIDSLEVSGQILDAFNKKPIENVLVLLYPEEEDSVLYKKPLYFSKTNQSGNYNIRNIKAGKYKIAALEDKNQNFIFDQSTERISFIEQVIEINENLTADPFYIFEEIKDISIINENNKTENYVFFEYNKAFSFIEFNVSNYNKEDIIYISEDKKLLHYWYLNKKEESEIRFITNNFLEDTFILNLKNDTTNRPIDINITTDIQNEKNVVLLEFPYPMSYFNEQKLKIQDDKLNNISYKFLWDKNKFSLSLITNTSVDSLNILIDKDCFRSFHYKTNDTIDLLLTDFTPKTSNLSLIIPFNEENNILQLINENDEVVKEQNVSRETNVIFENIKIGKYFIRIFEDKNNNGLWDSGLFHVKQYPEYTLFYSKEIEVKPNWDKDLEIKF